MKGEKLYDHYHKRARSMTRSGLTEDAENILLFIRKRCDKFGSWSLFEDRDQILKALSAGSVHDDAAPEHRTLDERLNIAIESVRSAGFISSHDDVFTVSESGRTAVTELERRRVREHYNRVWDYLEGSPTFATYCEHVYGVNLCQVNMTPLSHIDVMLSELDLKTSDRLLDIGCGTGRILEYCVEKTGCSAVGIDIAEKAIELMQRRIGNQQRLCGVAADSTDSPFRSESFDCIIAVDAFYADSTLPETLKEMVRLLRSRGRIAAFYGNNGKDRRRQEATETDFARACHDVGLSWRVIDFSGQLEGFWTKSRDWALELKPSFREEGREEHAEGLIRQAEISLTRIDHAVHYLYLID